MNPDQSILKLGSGPERTETRAAFARVTGADPHQVSSKGAPSRCNVAADLGPAGHGGGNGLADVRRRPAQGTVVASLRRLTEKEQQLCCGLMRMYAEAQQQVLTVRVGIDALVTVAEPAHAAILMRSIRDNVTSLRQKAAKAKREAKARAAGRRQKRHGRGDVWTRIARIIAESRA